jgi:hypothetical protein
LAKCHLAECHGTTTTQKLKRQNGISIFFFEQKTKIDQFLKKNGNRVCGDFLAPRQSA